MPVSNDKLESEEKKHTSSSELCPLVVPSS